MRPVVSSLNVKKKGWKLKIISSSADAKIITDWPTPVYKVPNYYSDAAKSERNVNFIKGDNYCGTKKKCISFK